MKSFIFWLIVWVASFILMFGGALYWESELLAIAGFLIGILAAFELGNLHE